MEDKYINLLLAICERAYQDLVTAYRKHDRRTIYECEQFFTTGTLFSFLNVDGEVIIKQARKEGRYNG